MQPLSIESITVDDIRIPLLEQKKIKMAVLRLDKIHPVIAGNKWFKLKYYLEEAKIKGQQHIITFGGAYSNHIVATAAAGNLYGLKTSGIIRGERPERISHTLRDATNYGMNLFFISRSDYRDKKLPQEIAEMIPHSCIIPEGGYGVTGTQGASEILNYCEKSKYSHICCAVGTTTMMAGIIKSSLPHQEVIGIPVLKNLHGQRPGMGALLDNSQSDKKYSFIHDYHFGGYAKFTPQLIQFMNELYRVTQIPTDFVYTGKLFYGVLDLIRNNSFKTGSHVLIIHSGGLQGNLSLPPGMLSF